MVGRGSPKGLNTFPRLIRVPALFRSRCRFRRRAGPWMCHRRSGGVFVYACWMEPGAHRHDIGSTVMARPGLGSARQSASRGKGFRGACDVSCCSFTSVPSVSLWRFLFSLFLRSLCSLALFTPLCGQIAGTRILSRQCSGLSGASPHQPSLHHSSAPPLRPLSSPKVQFLVNFYMNFATFAIPLRPEIG